MDRAYVEARPHPTAPQAASPAAVREARGKRVLDVLGGAVGLVARAALLPVAGTAILLESGRPIFFTQRRTGRNGRLFDMVKLRTMVRDAEPGGTPRWTEDDDPRVTRVGRWLRRYHLDELPNVWNVLRGEMSLVGPRPERPEFVERLAGRVPNYHARHLVRPGITGLAQLEGPYTNPIEHAASKLERDLAYIETQSLRLDLWILWRTAVMLARGSASQHG